MYPNDTTRETRFGYCKCGCGTQTRLATVTRSNRGWFKGQPMPFAPNHHARYAPANVRFWNAVNKGDPDSCWEWKAHRAPFGYGMFHVNGTPAYAHRFSYELHNGPIPDGLQVLHECDNPPCCNPNHLFLGTNLDNNKDMRQKGRGVNPPIRYGKRK